jgi:hypothetical protein
MPRRKPTFDEQLEQVSEDAQSNRDVEERDGQIASSAIDDEEDEALLAAWLAERETELHEQAFGLADPYDGDWRLP